ncbi:MAG TPA: amidohydrolase family protein [Actinophytocola sp.]|uniref:amidohydrolase family protein n=1 Tax=Actinophytocola sp. TaxID=1872138 RepID=UPI002DBDA60E|nr:amidohydrolase family protein [Actinophytocola sp.]HEU5474894.1 amidohydrolase family protein [Actinophytocola sp.]
MVDAHHHLWDPARRVYPWLTGLAAIQRRYTLDDLRAAAGPEVTATVLVQTVSSVAETAEFLATARESGGLVVGVIGWVDLSAADLRVPDGPLVGVRHQVEDEPDPDWLLRPDVGRGLRRLAGAGLVYDLLVRAAQRDAALAVARQVPELAFVLDHAGKPGIAGGEWEPWASWVTELARLPNVTCKLSGLVTEASWSSWAVADIRPYAEHVLDRFGADRVMFGSDWPVCELAGGYRAVRALTAELLAGASAAERAAVLGGTATRVYLS